MKYLSLTLDCGSEEFGKTPLTSRAEIARVLRSVAERIENGEEARFFLRNDEDEAIGLVVLEED